MKLALLGTVGGALALATVAAWGPAQAQCYWTGLDGSCAMAPTYSYTYPYYGYPGYGEDWSQQYYAPYTNYKAPWMPVYPGPRPSPD